MVTARASPPSAAKVKSPLLVKRTPYTPVNVPSLSARTTTFSTWPTAPLLQTAWTVGPTIVICAKTTPNPPSTSTRTFPESPISTTTARGASNRTSAPSGRPTMLLRIGLPTATVHGITSVLGAGAGSVMSLGVMLPITTDAGEFTGAVGVG